MNLVDFPGKESLLENEKLELVGVRRDTRPIDRLLVDIDSWSDSTVKKKKFHIIIICYLCD